MKSKQEAFREGYSKFMLVFAVASQAWLAIQTVDIYRKKSTDGLSLVAFILLAVGHVIWLIYAVFVLQPRNKVIILSSSLALVFSILIVIGIIIY